jgi:hypothetical protein
MFDSVIKLNVKNKARKSNKINLSEIDFFQTLSFNAKYYAFENSA